MQPARLWCGVLLGLTFLVYGVAANEYYNVYRRLYLLETKHRYDCLQCFIRPCLEGEMEVAPMDTMPLCCRTCTIVGPGHQCAVYRQHKPEVCDEGYRCDTRSQVCVSSLTHSTRAGRPKKHRNILWN